MFLSMVNSSILRRAISHPFPFISVKKPLYGPAKVAGIAGLIDNIAFIGEK